MNIVFYSTYPVKQLNNSLITDSKKLTQFPSCQNEFLEFCKKYPEHNFYCVYEGFSYFLPDEKKSPEVFVLPCGSSIEEICNKIISLSPSLCIAVSIWAEPFDWLCCNDALVKEDLERNGIKTICNSVELNLKCFDKYLTDSFLRQNNFLTPNSIFVNHNLYFCAGSNKTVTSNVYKNLIFSQIKKMNFPLVIKECTGLSSLGAEVVNTFGECKAYLNSKKNNSDRIICEYIKGRHFGVEVYKDTFSIFEISLNRYGITSPKQSVKLNETLNDDEFNSLKEIIKNLQEQLNAQNCIQIDLILSEKKSGLNGQALWYILEINPRQSGMTNCVCVEQGKSIFELLFENSSDKTLNENQNKKRVLSIKLPVFSDGLLKEINELKLAKKIIQFENLEAKQEREKGWCEIILCDESYSKLTDKMHQLKNFLINKENFDEFMTALQHFELMH
ncbi:MAG: ATP-grasp domain-containing protein [Spirochaetales bacterium]|nr:ATP-grasp domain-containing protein [Spirochaetales bacterium]